MEEDNEVALETLETSPRQAQQYESAQNSWSENLPSTMMESGLRG